MLIEKIGTAAMLEQTAEECTELAQACLKLARKRRRENPTTRPESALLDNLHEEIVDVSLCIHELESICDEEQLKKWVKAKRETLEDRFKQGE